VAIVVDATEVPGQENRFNRAKNIAAQLLWMLRRTGNSRVAVIAYGADQDLTTQDAEVILGLTSNFEWFNATSIESRGNGTAPIGRAMGVTSADVFEGVPPTPGRRRHAIVIHQRDTSESSFLFSRDRARYYCCLPRAAAMG
jgi:Mg-chelatase subunit ChlD